MKKRKKIGCLKLAKRASTREKLLTNRLSIRACEIKILKTILEWILKRSKLIIANGRREGSVDDKQGSALGTINFGSMRL